MTLNLLKRSNAEITALEAEFEGTFSALCHTSTELQKANSKIEEQKSTIALLTAENDDLRRQLEPEDVNGADAPMAGDDDDSSSSSSEPVIASDPSDIPTLLKI